MSKNLTEIVKHPLSKKDVAGYVRYDESEWGQHMVTRCPGESVEYFTGPVVDRLHEYESTGLEPEEIKTLMEVHADLLRKQKKEKVVVEKTFHQLVDMMPYEMNGCTTYSYVEERRHYCCPSCNNEIVSRYKTTKLYPNRTIGTETDHTRPINYERRANCAKCGQALDWSDVDKEIWA